MYCFIHFIYFVLFFALYGIQSTSIKYILDPMNANNVEKSVEECRAKLDSIRKRKKSTRDDTRRHNVKKANKKYRKNKRARQNKKTVDHQANVDNNGNTVEVEEAEIIHRDPTNANAAIISQEVAEDATDDQGRDGDEEGGGDDNNGINGSYESIEDINEGLEQAMNEQFREVWECKAVEISSLLDAVPPTKESSVRLFISEIAGRGEICIQRNQIDSALKIFTKGISCLMYYDSSMTADTRRMVAVLYVKCCLCMRLKGEMYHREARKFAKRAVQTFHYSIEAIVELADSYNMSVDDESFHEIFAETLGGAGTRPEGLVDPRHCLLNGVTTNLSLPQGTSDLDHKSDLEYSYGHLISGTCSESCGNCCRRQITHDLTDPYYFDMYCIWNRNIMGSQSPLRIVTAARSASTSECVYLCSECHHFLVKSKSVRRSERYRWKNVWPSFYWNLLTGHDINTGKNFHCTYAPEELWRYIPESMRRYWVDSIHDRRLVNLYGDCTVNEPKSHFSDRTKDVRLFWASINAYTFEGMLRVLDPERLSENERDGGISESMILPNVLCPWGCSEFCFRTTELNLGLLLQHHLRKVQLNLPQQEHQKMYTVDSSRLDYIRKDEEDHDYILLNRDWPILPSVRLTRDGGLIVCTCRHHGSDLTRKRLLPHPPRKPYSDNLSSVRPDQLCQAVVQPCMRPAVRKGCNTVPSLNMFTVNYQGAWSSNVCIDKRFDNNGERRMSQRHEALSLHRPDIQQLATHFVENGTVSHELSTGWGEEYEKYDKSMLRSLTRGATYTPSINAIILQRFSSEEYKIMIKDYRKCSSMEDLSELKTIFAHRSWCPTIYNMQVEDPEGYGCRIVGIEPMTLLKDQRQQSNMLTWAIVGLVSSCKELYHALDQRRNGHASNNMAGHVLSYIHHRYMKQCNKISVKQSPFKAAMAINELCSIVGSSISPSVVRASEYRIGQEEDYFLFGYSVLYDLFDPNDYSSVSVVKSLQEIDSHSVVGKDIIIRIAEHSPVGCAHCKIGGELFEARVLVAVSVDKDETHNFNGVRMARHGGEYRNWWRQDRKSKRIMTQHVRSITEDESLDEYPKLPKDMFRYVTVFVRVEEFQVSEYKLDLMRSLGIQCSLFCGCCPGEETPLIVSGKGKAEKRQCMSPNCNAMENYTCPKARCRSRVCTSCFKKMTSGGKTCTLRNDNTTNMILNSLEGSNNEDDTGTGDDFGIFEEMNPDDLDSDDDSCDISYTSFDCEASEEGFDVDLVDHEDVSWDDVTPEELDFLDRDCQMMRRSRSLGVVELPPGYYNICEGIHDDDYTVEMEDLEYIDTTRILEEEVEPSKLDLAIETGKAIEAGRVEGFHYNPLDRLLTNADVDPLDVTLVYDMDYGVLVGEDTIPRINGSYEERPILDRNRSNDGSLRVPMHVLFNQAGRVCSRRNREIKGSQLQRSFVQKLASTIYGKSFPLLFSFNALLFPKHFWANSRFDKISTLGCAPISCYRKQTNPDGFASTLQIARNLSTHSSSSTSTDDNFISHLYDIQANAASAGIDSRLATRAGFKVCTSSSSGLQLGDYNSTEINQSLDSGQGAMNLAAAADKIRFDLFVTYTCNQSNHPGICHLHRWKESKEWTKQIKDYESFSAFQKEDADKSMEMAYCNILSRSWLEVRKLWLQFIIYSSTTKLGRVLNAFFRDEYQECSGNLCHIHGLLGLLKGDMENEEFLKLVCELQANYVIDILPPSEIEDFISKGLIKDQNDWTTLQATATQVLTHNRHTKRCLVRKNYTGIFDEDFACRKPHPVFDSINPLEDEFIPLPFEFSETCVGILEKTGLWIPPCPAFPKGKVKHPMLEPKRHMGFCHPGARENMSPVNGQHFAFTRSMQNIQIISGTNGVARYVVKYIIKMDKANRCVLWADARDNAVLRAEHQFLHNTKIATSSINEKKAFDKSRQRNHPVGRYIGLPQMLHQLLGESDIHTNLVFEEVCTRPFEYRSTTSFRLNREGKPTSNKNQVTTEGTSDGSSTYGQGTSDTTSPVTDSYSLRKVTFTGNPARQFTENQKLLFRSGSSSAMAYDKVTLFGIRPVEILQLFPRLREYYEWFEFSKNVMKPNDIANGLNEDVTKCMWIDGLGRRVKLRKRARPYVAASLRKINEAHVHPHSWKLRCHLLYVIENHQEEPLFISNDDTRLPICVFSRLSPNRSNDFLYHIMLVLGEYDTEYDFKVASSMKHSLAKAKLIPFEALEDDAKLAEASTHLLKRVIEEVLPLQPVTMTKIDDFIVKADELLHSVLFEDSIPMTSLPSCILSELLNEKNEEMEREWKHRRSAQLDSMMLGLKGVSGLPKKEDVLNATKVSPIKWNPLEVIKQTEEQSDESYNEQQFALSLGIKAIDSYSRQFGKQRYAKGILTNGAPGAGKTFITQAEGFYGMTQGLKVMSSSLMAIRSTAIGGYHLHRLFQWPVGKRGNLYRLAELALDKLYRKSNMRFLHLLLTMDMLILDEVGQLSAEQFALVDIVLRHARKSSLPFGGVLVCGTFDHAQLGSIEGIPFLLSTHILSDFTLVKLEHSVRAAGDPTLQRIQNITRMSPYALRKSEELRTEFTKLVSENIRFIDSMENAPDNSVRLFHRKKSAVKQVQQFIDHATQNLRTANRKYTISKSVDMHKISGTHGDPRPTIDTTITNMLNRKVREPPELLFYSGALFEATTNTSKYQQSQVLLMLDVPTPREVLERKPLVLFACPTDVVVSASLYSFSSPPSEKELLDSGWKKVKVRAFKQRFVTEANISACRNQYGLRHLGANTVNSTQGRTLTVPSAIEVNEQFYPWERGQVVVELSRNKICADIIIAGKKEFAIKRLYDTLCIVTQFTRLTESIVGNLSLTAANRTHQPTAQVIDYADDWPYRVSDIILPKSNSGFVYCLVSCACPEKRYIGYTRNISTRLNDHNSGYGSFGTNINLFMPWAVAAYICGLGELSDTQLKSLEGKWQSRNEQSLFQKRTDIEAVIENGRRVCQDYNEEVGNGHPSLKGNYVVTLNRRYAVELEDVNDRHNGIDEEFDSDSEEENEDSFNIEDSRMDPEVMEDESVQNDDQDEYLECDDLYCTFNDVC